MAQEIENAAKTTEAATKAGERFATATAERMGSAARPGGAAEAAFKAMRDCNTRLVQVFQSNAEANLKLGQTLMQLRTPTDFLAAVSQSTRERTDLIAGQTKELVSLRHEATRRMFEAIVPGR